MSRDADDPIGPPASTLEELQEETRRLYESIAASRHKKPDAAHRRVAPVVVDPSDEEDEDQGY